MGTLRRTQCHNTTESLFVVGLALLFRGKLLTWATFDFDAAGIRVAPSKTLRYHLGNLFEAALKGNRLAKSSSA